MGTKREGDRCYDAALDDEPMFVLLGRDPSAPALVRQWAAIRRVDVEAGTRPATDLKQIEEAEALAERMKAWRIDADEAWRTQPSFFESPLADQHLATRQGDEYFCSRCHKRWGVDEDAPERCEDFNARHPAA